MNYRIDSIPLNIEHRHSDGSWGSLVPRRGHHDAADHDEERDWKNGDIYQCTTCDEQVRVRPIEDPGVSRG